MQSILPHLSMLAWPAMQVWVKRSSPRSGMVSVDIHAGSPLPISCRCPWRVPPNKVLLLPALICSVSALFSGYLCCPTSFSSIFLLILWITSGQTCCSTHQILNLSLCLLSFRNLGYVVIWTFSGFRFSQSDWHSTSLIRNTILRRSSPQPW